MVLVFGWGHGPVEDRGEVAPLRCPNCHNDVFLHKIRSTKRVSLFFVPIMPYGTDEYLVCPVCASGLQISLAQQSAVDAMRTATAWVRAGKITEPDYRARTEAFWRLMGVARPTPEPVRAPPAEALLADRLAGLARLHAGGVLTDDEFSAAKHRLLER